MDAFGNVYIADRGNSRIRKVSDGVITTVVGGGSGSGNNDPTIGPQLGDPTGEAVAVDAAGNLYFDSSDGIRKVSNGVITIVAGTNSAHLYGPFGVAVDAAGNVYISDFYNNRVLIATPASGTVVFPAPSISPNGIVPLFSSSTTIQPGEWVSIYGNNLASGTTVWNGDFPISLGGTSVKINGKPAYLSLASPGQINFEAPDDGATGIVPVIVTTAGGSVSSTVTLGQFGPSFSLLDSKHVAILHS